MRPIRCRCRLSCTDHHPFRTLSPKAAAGVEDGVKPAHLCVCSFYVAARSYCALPEPRCQSLVLFPPTDPTRRLSRPRPSLPAACKYICLFVYSVAFIVFCSYHSDSEAEDNEVEFDSEAEFFSSPSKSQGNKVQTSSKGAKRKLEPARCVVSVPVRS